MRGLTKGKNRPPLQRGFEYSQIFLLLNATKGAIVVAFHPAPRGWLAAAEVHTDAALTTGLPPLDGRLVTDDVVVTAATDDFGHIEHRPRPRFCNPDP